MAKEEDGEESPYMEKRGLEYIQKKARCETDDNHKWGTSVICFSSNMNLKFRLFPALI